MKKLTRRSFVKQAAGSALAAGLGVPLPGAPAEKSKVVLVRDEAALDGDGRIDAGVVARMLDEAVVELTGTKDAAAAWRRLVPAGRRVGIKSNVWAHLPTPAAIEDRIKEGAKLAGAKEVVIDDRGARKSLSESEVLINARPLRTHHWAGIGGCLKNYIMFVPSPWLLHPDNCADLGKLFTLPEVKGKTLLNVLVALTPLFFGKGPHHFKREFTWPYKGLIVSADPVAADATGVRLLEAKRREHFGRETPLMHLAHHVELAEEKWGVGVADPARIELVKLGWEEGAMI